MTPTNVLPEQTPLQVGSAWTRGLDLFPLGQYGFN